MTVNLTLQTFVDSIARTANKGFSIAGGGPCFANRFVQGGSSVLRMNCSANNPRHSPPPETLTTIKIK